MGCDSQFDGLYENRRELQLQRQAEAAERTRSAKSRGFTPQGEGGRGPYAHEACGSIVSDMDKHITVCPFAVGTSPIGYTPKHRADIPAR